MKITWLGHSTFQLQFPSGEVLVLDPWIEGNPKHPSGHKFERVDAIALSHAHFDHANDVVPLAKKFDSKVIAIFETAQWLQKHKIKDAVGMNKGGSIDLGFVKLTMTHALHSNTIKDGDDLIYAGEAAGWILTLPDDRRAYFAGDTAVFGDMAIIGELYTPQLAFLPIGDFYTMGPEQAAKAASLLKVKTIIPMHWGTFPALLGTPEQLEQYLAGSAKVWTLEPGKTVEWLASIAA